MKLTHCVSILFLLFLFSGCSHNEGLINKYGTNQCYKTYSNANRSYTIHANKYNPLKKVSNYTEVGVASWYGSKKGKTTNKKTAGGDKYNKRKLTAAHKTLPLLSMVKVTNLSNNKNVVVVITDRGPFVKGRIIDVSERASEELGFKYIGTTKVKVEFLKKNTSKLINYVKQNRKCKSA